MKPFLPFLLLPALALTGWGLAAQTPAGTTLAVPTIAAMEAPPSLGQPAAAPAGRGPVQVRMHALLPPPVAPLPPAEIAQQEPLPEVTAILIHGPRRVAQIDGQAMSVGDRRGSYRLAAIEPDRVLLEQTVLRRQRWVPVTDQ